ncbi:hypothetical protein [Sphingomonas sp. 3-13AW]|uniref:hypothetical protein n=1 Tax=Sphingomonas sp. 3-13AW TaxID=3050450 RepID=UPI003BB64582
MATDLTVPRTTLTQLGGNRFVAMTGAKSFAGDSNSLTFRLPASMTKGRATGIRIVLTGNDDYTLETFKVVNHAVTRLELCECVYVENLRETFTEMTGLSTRL